MTADKSRALGFCKSCGCRSDEPHRTDCASRLEQPLTANAALNQLRDLAQSAPLEDHVRQVSRAMPLSAYDIDQAKMRARIEALETCAVQTSGSLNKALARIEQLEESNGVRAAQLSRAFQRIEKLETDIKLDRGEAIKSEERIEEQGRIIDRHQERIDVLEIGLLSATRSLESLVKVLEAK